MKPAPLLVLSLLLAACQPAPPAAPSLSEARIQLPPPGGSMAAGYFELRNPGKAPLELRGVHSAAFDSVEMHETVQEDGVARMRAVARVEIPAGGSVSFAPGGKHLMLMGPKLADPAPAGLTLTLELAAPGGQTQSLEATFAVAGASQDSTHDHAHHHHE